MENWMDIPRVREHELWDYLIEHDKVTDFENWLKEYRKRTDK